MFVVMIIAVLMGYSNAKGLTVKFKDAFNIRNKRDNRKYQEFANLVRGFARLQGDAQIGISHVGEAYKIFAKSL